MWLINNYKRLLSVSRWVLFWYQASYISHFNPESNNLRGFPGSSVVKTLLANAEDACLIPGSRSPGGDGNLLQYSYLENPMVRGAWRAAVHEVSKSGTWLSNWACTHSGKDEITSTYGRAWWACKRVRHNHTTKALIKQNYSIQRVYIRSKMKFTL